MTLNARINFKNDIRFTINIIIKFVSVLNVTVNNTCVIQAIHTACSVYFY